MRDPATEPDVNMEMEFVLYRDPKALRGFFKPIICPPLCCSLRKSCQGLGFRDEVNGKISQNGRWTYGHSSTGTG